MGLGRYQKGTLENCSEHFRARARGLYTVNLEGEEAAGVLSGIDYYPSLMVRSFVGERFICLDC